MPFDQREFTVVTKPEVRIIDSMIERLRDPKRWNQGSLCSQTGDAVCLVGAYRLAVYNKLEGGMSLYGQSSLFAVDAALHHAAETYKIAYWNDRHSTTHADVMRVLHRARALLF